MFRLFRAHLFGLLVAALAIAPAAAFMDEQPAPLDALKPPPLTDYLPEDAAAMWDVLATTLEANETRDDGIWIVPVFSDSVKALDGKVIRVTGFMFPVEAGERHSYFLMQPRPPHCPFCFNVGANQVIEVRLDMPIAYTSLPLTLEGALTLVSDDERGIFYRMNAARVAN
ncbi:MAG TPA: DUF3299 domain-containing protein [Micropepsaceae bacterium]|nr:DUF3299 domain-containing protein [Micropepsaceae bacterium]